MSEIQIATALLDIGLREVLGKVRKKYHLPIGVKVLMADYDDAEGDLYVRFRETEPTEGESADDGLLIVHRDMKNRIVAIEVLNLTEL